MKVTRNQKIALVALISITTLLTYLNNRSKVKIEYSTTIVTPVEVAEDITFEEAIPSEESITFENVNQVQEQTEDNKIFHYSDNGTFIVPYPDYDNFPDAFAYARQSIGDSTSEGRIQLFLWRGNKYHTETLKNN